MLTGSLRSDLHVSAMPQIVLQSFFDGVSEIVELRFRKLGGIHTWSMQKRGIFESFREFRLMLFSDSQSAFPP
jgi:hypothetical protein